MRQIAGIGISTQRGTFITWHKYVCFVFFKMHLYSQTGWKQAVEVLNSKVKTVKSLMFSCVCTATP